MKCVYEAANSIEGHMIVDLLEQEGIQAHLDGEFLQGGVGELQAINLIRIMVHDSDFARARECVLAWEQTQGSNDSAENLAADIQPAQKFGSGVVWLLIGWLLGAMSTAYYFKSPITSDGIDYDGDGSLDETYSFHGERLVRIEQDRNRDGQVDAKYLYDHRGLSERAVLDDDFNEVFETELIYRQGNIINAKADTTGDGFHDYRESYTDGVLDSATVYDSESHRMVKRRYHKFGKLVSSMVDTTGDGKFDTYFKYDHFEEPIPSVPNN